MSRKSVFLSGLFVVLSISNPSLAQDEDKDSVEAITKLNNAKLERLKSEKALNAANAKPASTVSIRSVEYGHEQNTCSAYGLFATVCKGQATCQVEINNAMCGDPNPKPKNTATVVYSCGKDGEPKTVHFEEGVKAYLVCP